MRGVVGARPTPNYSAPMRYWKGKAFRHGDVLEMQIEINFRHGGVVFNCATQRGPTCWNSNVALWQTNQGYTHSCPYWPARRLIDARPLIPRRADTQLFPGPLVLRPVSTQPPTDRLIRTHSCSRPRTFFTPRPRSRVIRNHVQVRS